MRRRWWIAVPLLLLLLFLRRGGLRDEEEATAPPARPAGTGTGAGEVAGAPSAEPGHSEGRPEGEPAELEKQLSAVHHHRQKLERAPRASLPTREVVVDGLPADGFALLRADSGNGGRRWRVEVHDGRARFPALEPDTWLLTLVRPGRPDVPRRVRVEKGEGTVTFRFPKIEDG